MVQAGGRVVVVGSVNSDLLLAQSRLPLRGETFVASEVREEFGGKGANQAVQCARLGAETVFIGAVGSDARGGECRQNLLRNGVRAHLRVVDGPTGIGVVQVLPSGEVFATIHPGANAGLRPSDVLDHRELFAGADAVLLQNEVAPEVNSAAVLTAREHGVPVFYNAAPARPASEAVAREADYLLVNEEEAAALLARWSMGAPGALETARLLTSVCRGVVLTLGRAGSVVAAAGRVDSVAAVSVEAVDTTGAGDSYTAAFVVGLGRGWSPVRAARFASRAAALSTRGLGAQTSMPSAAEAGLPAVSERWRAPSGRRR